MLTTTNTDMKSDKVDLSPREEYLFIGNSEFYYNTLKPLFSRSNFVSSLQDAKSFMLQTSSVPDMIVIDTKLNHLELVEFNVWARTNHLHKIPIIYNQKMLAHFQVKQLFSQKLVEDVLNLETNYRKLSYKFRFFQKIGRLREEDKKMPEKPMHLEATKVGFTTRLLDLVISSCAIILVSPLFVIIPLAIRLESKGPVFYSARRAGKGFKVFPFYKFRTMVMDADQRIHDFNHLNKYKVEEKQPVFIKFQNDPRVTKVGAFLRRTSLDELPQFFNVIKGDMSIVGNRPLPLYEASTLTTDAWAERFMAPAGITGLWQVTKRGKEEMNLEERILLDITYARTRSLLGDIIILLKTPGALLQQTEV